MAPAPPILFDAVRRMRRQTQATQSGGEYLWREAGDGVLARLMPVTVAFETAAAVDGRAPVFLPRLGGWRQGGFDADERLAIDGKCDLAVSLLSLHAINDLPGALRPIRLSLNPGGLFLAAMFGGQTLYELRDSLAAGDATVRGAPRRRIAPLADVRDLGMLLQRAGFAMPVADVERTVARYRDLRTLISDLRRMGETGILSGPRSTYGKRALAVAKDHYAKHYGDADAKLRATFDIVYLTGWALSKETIRRKLTGGQRR